VTSIPSPSPNHHTTSDHTIETASPTCKVGRNAIAKPIASWRVAKTALMSTGLPSTIWAAHRIEEAIQSGLPSAMPGRKDEEKSFENM